MQFPSQQPCCHYTPLPPSRHPSLSANGQVKVGHAADPFPCPRHSILETCTFRFLLELVCCHSCILRRDFRLHLLRPDALLPSPPNLTFLLEGVKEVPPSTPLHGLRERLWCDESILGRYLRDSANSPSDQDVVRGQPMPSNAKHDQ